MPSSASSHRRPVWIGAVVVLLGVAVVAIALASLTTPGAKGSVVTTKASSAQAIGRAAIVPVTTTTVAPAKSSLASATVTTAAAPSAVAPARPSVAAVAAGARPKADPVTTVAGTIVPVVTVPAPATTVPAASTTTAPVTTATIWLRSAFSTPVAVTVGGHTYTVDNNRGVGPIMVTPASGNDVVEVRSVADPTCGMGDASGYFTAGKWYDVYVTASLPDCNGTPGPGFQVTETLAMTG